MRIESWLGYGVLEVLHNKKRLSVTNFDRVFLTSFVFWGKASRGILVRYRDGLRIHDGCCSVMNIPLNQQ